jgi:hypothetical protein
MLGICNLYYQGAKGHIYSTCTGRKYAENPLTDGENTMYNIHLTITTLTMNECSQVETNQKETILPNNGIVISLFKKEIPKFNFKNFLSHYVLETTSV